jgi:diguanylate cyclase (GGDEF)-like protein/PAS domain S-box-containing protein
MNDSNHGAILATIESVRKLMIQVGLKQGLTADDTVEISKSLDGLLNELQKRSYDCYSCKLDFAKINSVIQTEAKILVSDIDGFIIYVNEICSNMLGFSQEELIGENLRIFDSGYHSNEFFKNMWMTIKTGERWKGEIQTKKNDGSTAWNFLSIFPIPDKDGQPYQFLTLWSDISERKRVEFKTAHKRNQLSYLAKNSSDVIGIFDKNGIVTYINPAVERILGFTVLERIGSNTFNYIDEEYLSEAQRLVEELIKTPGKSFRIELKLKHKKGHSVWCEVNCTNHLNDSLIQGIVFNYRDITEQMKYAEEINQMAYFDYLTGLPNRRNFEKQLNEELEIAREKNLNIALLLLDLDGFKHLNDSLGHEVGDQLLKDVSSRIKNSIHDQAFFGRLGGDEFVLFFNDAQNFSEIHKEAKKLVSLISEEPYNLDGFEFFISASIGVSIFPHSGENLISLLQNADMAMYRAKNNGKNQYQFFSPTMNITNNKEFMLRNDMKKAIANDEFVIFYQPRFNPMTDRITGTEALLRWNHPAWGWISPNEFIPLAEETGLIIPIGEWLIRRVCYQIKEWQLEGLDTQKISINISSLQLLKSNFVEMVSFILEETSLNAQFIEFEITESVIIDKEVQVLKALTQLIELGISISLDDFGTGYSALNYLRKFPCDTVKIDKSLIDHIQTDIGNYEIVAAIINLCQKLKKSVVAEGVETDEQLSLLKNLSCNEIQGYIYSKPIDELLYKAKIKMGKWTNLKTTRVKK